MTALTQILTRPIYIWRHLRGLFRISVCLSIYGLLQVALGFFPNPWTPNVTENGLIIYNFLKALWLFPCTALAGICFQSLFRADKRAPQLLQLLLLTGLMAYPFVGLPYEMLAERFTPDRSGYTITDTIPFHRVDQPWQKENGPIASIGSSLIPFRPEQNISLVLDTIPFGGSIDGAGSRLSTVSGEKGKLHEISSSVVFAVESNKPEWIMPVRVLPFHEPYFWRSQRDYRSRLLCVDAQGSFQLADARLTLLPLLTSLLPLICFWFLGLNFARALGLAGLWMLCFTPWIAWWLPLGTIAL